MDLSMDFSVDLSMGFIADFSMDFRIDLSIDFSKDSSKDLCMDFRMDFLPEAQQMYAPPGTERDGVGEVVRHGPGNGDGNIYRAHVGCSAIGFQPVKAVFWRGAP